MKPRVNESGRNRNRSLFFVWLFFAALATAAVLVAAKIEGDARFRSDRVYESSRDMADGLKKITSLKHVSE